jgi:hypothetical protein
VRLGSGLALAPALVVAACGGGSNHARHASSATRTRSAVGTRARTGSVRATQLPPRDPVLARLGLPALHDHSPLPGYVLIADRDNNRIIIVNPSGRIVWRFPRRGALASGQEFAGPDDACITPNGRFITTNEELSDTVAVLSLERHPKIVWQYGHQDVQGSGPGYLAHPDDAYMVHGNEIQVADIINCRVLWLGQDRQIVHAIGTAGDCVHDPPHALLAPNGDTPLPDGNALVAGYNDPGRIDVITPAGHILWTYGPSSGPGSLNQPSLAVQLPNGLIAATDDWNERVVVIDPRLHRIVWQYGHDHVAGSASGYLRKPDGLDLVP